MVLDLTRKHQITNKIKQLSFNCKYLKRWTIILLSSLVISGFMLSIAIRNNFWPIGWDTYFHIKYARFILKYGKIPVTNPYFPRFPHAYPPCTHILTASMSLIMGLDIISLYSILPAIFSIPIFINFYLLAKTYLKDRFAYLTTILFFLSSLWHKTIYATNSAPLNNSLIFHFTLPKII